MQNIHQSCSAIPLHIQRHVAKYGDAEARIRAAATMRHTARIAEDRSHALIRPAGAAAPLPAKRRIVYDAHHKQTLPGKLVMADGNAVSSDVEAMEAFDGCGVTYDFFDKIFGRKSVDDKGQQLISTVHYGRNFDNAMWNGRQMVYGDGDGKLFNRFTIAQDVIAHELTHGVTQNTAALEYQGQSGALNEHLSDAFGIMVKQWMLGLIASQSDWLIGKGLLGPRVRGKAIRSMKAPGTAYDDPVLGRDPQPAHMRNYVTTVDDNGGVHINSGIPNHAFYLIAIRLGGNAWVVPGRIWYVVLTTMLFPHAGFQDFASATVVAAGAEYGVGSTIQMTVAQAWSEVGLAVPPPLTRKTQLPPSRFHWRGRRLPRLAA
jgi:Zn-dependent metalloprotease